MNEWGDFISQFSRDAYPKAGAVSEFGQGVRGGERREPKFFGTPLTIFGTPYHTLTI